MDNAKKELNEQQFLRTLYETRKPVFPAEKVLKYIEESIKNVESPDDVASSAYTIDSDLSTSMRKANQAGLFDQPEDLISEIDIDNTTDLTKNLPTGSASKTRTNIDNSTQSARSTSLSETVNLMAKKISLFDKIVKSAKSQKLEKTDPKKPEKLKLPFGSRSKILFGDLQQQITKLKKKLNDSPQNPVDNKNYAKIVKVTFDNKTLIPINVEIFDKEKYKNNNTENPKDLVSMKTFIAYQLQNNKKGLTTDGETTMSFYYNGDEKEASKMNFENPIL